MNQGHQIYAFCLIKGAKVFAEDRPNLHYIWRDFRNPEILKNFLKDIEAAYYVVQSISEIVGHLVDTEIEVVKHFLNGVKNSRIKQIIYLRGIINDEKKIISPP